jgi:hypothetical protein
VIRFFDLLAIDRTLSPPEQLDAAAAKWPSEEVQPVTGDAFGNTDDYLGLVEYLQDVLFFTAVRSGASGGTVGIGAELHVGAPTSTQPWPLVVAKMPDVAFFLQETHGVPAQLHVTQNADDRLDVVIQGLPVEIRLPPGFIRPQRMPEDAGGGELLDFTTTVAPFDPTDPDSLQITLRDFDRSSIFVRVNAKMTPEFDFAIDTHMPITIGPCVFLDLPCEALHDLQLIPSPRLQHLGEIPVEWTRHHLDKAQLSSTIPGLYTFRAIELDRKAEPVAELLGRISTTRPSPLEPLEPPERNELEPIIEDVAFPAFMSPLPLPVHIRVGLRRVVVDLDAPGGEEYALETAPAEIPIRSWRLKIFRLVLQTTKEPQAVGEIEGVLVAGSDPQSNWSFGFDYNDDGVLIATAIIPVEDRVLLFRILNREVRVIGLKVGYSLFEPDPRRVGEKPAIVVPLGDVGWANRLILLIDFEVKDAGERKTFAFRDKGGPNQPTILHDLGWYLGGLALGAFYDSDGIEVVALGKFRIEVMELGVVSATNGASYLMLSAGIDLGIGTSRKSTDTAQPGDPAQPAPLGSEESRQRGGGVQLHRLKLRMGTGADEAPDILLDGLSLSLRTKRIELEGFGMISDHFIGGTRLQEFAFALRARFELMKKQLDLGVQFFYGSASGAENFNYWLFSLYVGELPLGSTELSNLRVLVAGNMRPRLAPPDGNPNPLRLFRWYKSDDDAITLPLNRKLTKWERHEDAFALGAGARLHLAGTKFASLDIFFFVHRSAEEAGMFGAMECYLGKGEKPIAYGVLEFDFKSDSWAAEFGVNLGIENVVGDPTLPEPLKKTAALTGTLFLARNIDAIALGQYADPATWLTARVTSPTGLKAELWFAVCVHSVDAPQGPDVIAVSAGGKGTLDFAVGALKLYATLTVVWQPWRNESHESGLLARIEAGVRIRIFRVINFGAVIEIELDWLDTKPRYSRQSFCFRIETPWWLPDVTIRFENHSGEPNVSRLTVASTPLIGASALPPVASPPSTVGVTPLVGPVLNEKAVHNLDTLRATAPAVVDSSAFDALEPIATDSRVALDFKASLEAPMTIVPETPAGIGTQTSAEIEVRYELVEIGIRRRKRFGPGAGVWTDLITPESTHIHSPEDVNTTFTSAVRFEWDVDVVRAGRTDTRRLLINADTAYSFSSSNPEGDDVASTTFPGWPCCTTPRRPTVWHEVDFDGTAFGVRTPLSQRFTHSHSTLHWQGGPPPVVAPAVTAPAGSACAFVHVPGRPAGPLAVASFDERAAICEIFIYWKPVETGSVIVVEAFDGLKVLESQRFPFIAGAPPVIRFNVAGGMTSLLIRKVGEIEPAEGDAEFVRIRYRTTREVLDDALYVHRCENADDRVHGSGMLAWLPNRDYEVTVRVRVGLAHERSGAQDATVEQKAYFRTKGLPGLNAVARVGDEVEPYVDSRYPPPGAVRLYRREPLAVAFTERFNILVPVNRTPSTAEEANQILEWVLVVEKVGGVMGYERLSQTAPDWVVEHRGVEPTPRPRNPAVLDAAIFHTGERKARSIDPLVVRYEAMKDRPGGCIDPGDGLHPSQVLLHEPYDPGASEGATPRWEPEQELRVNLREKDAPFVERTAFEAADATAFTQMAVGGPPAVWASDEGAMRVVADPQPADAQYAVFGEADWRHLRIETIVDPAGAEAGVAVAVAGTRSVEALLSSTGTLRIVERDGATIRELAPPINVGEPGAVPLEVVAFDDRIRATVGEQSIEGALGTTREGRPALVSRGGGRFLHLLVTGLDAWRFHAHTSRYDDFAGHIESFEGVLGVLKPGDAGAPTATVADLRAQTAAEIPQVMTERADAEMRQRLFETWTTSLGLPLRESPRILCLTRWVEEDTTPLLVLESDEPLPFSSDVTLALSERTRAAPWPPPMPELPVEIQQFLVEVEYSGEDFTGPKLPTQLRPAQRILRADVRHGVASVEVFDIEIGPDGKMLAKRGQTTASWPAELDPPLNGDFVFVDEQGHPLLPPLPSPTPIVWAPLETQVLTDRDEIRALIIPDVTLTAGTYRLALAIDRPRWRTATPDAASNYRAGVTLPLNWS